MLVFLAIIAGVVLVILYMQGKKSGSQNPILFIGISLLIVSILIASLFQKNEDESSEESSPVFNAQSVIGCGGAIAVSQSIPEGGEVVVLTCNKGFTRQSEQDVKAALDGFASCASSNIKILHEQSPPNFFAEGRTIPSQMVDDVLSRHPKAKALASLIGSPDQPAALAVLRQPNPPIIIVFSEDAKSVFPAVTGGQITALISPKHTPGEMPPALKSPRDIFPHHYVIVTAQNAAQHSDLLKRPGAR